MSVSSSGFNLEDTVIDGQKGYVKCSSSQIEDKDVPLALSLFV